MLKIIKFKKFILKIIGFFIIVCFAGINHAYAIEVEGTNTGLRVTVSDIPVPTDNLAPGDTKTSTMTLDIDPESSTSSLRVWIRSEIIESVLGKEVNGIKGNLDDRLILKVTHENGKELHNGPISKFNENVLVGDIQKGNPVNLEFTVHLPGESTGNEYQGSALKVKWIITAQYEPIERPTPTRPLTRPTITPPQRVTTIPSPTPEPTGPVVPTQQVTPTETPEIYEIEDEDTPVGYGEQEEDEKPGEDETELVIIQEEELPKGLPKTGELPPVLFYGLGAGIIYAGLKLNHKKQK